MNDLMNFTGSCGAWFSMFGRQFEDRFGEPSQSNATQQPGFATPLPQMVAEFLNADFEDDPVGAASLETERLLLHDASLNLAIVRENRTCEWCSAQATVIRLNATTAEWLCSDCLEYSTYIGD